MHLIPRAPSQLPSAWTSASCSVSLSLASPTASWHDKYVMTILDSDKHAPFSPPARAHPKTVRYSAEPALTYVRQRKRGCSCLFARMSKERCGDGREQTRRCLCNEPTHTMNAACMRYLRMSMSMTMDKRYAQTTKWSQRLPRMRVSANQRVSEPHANSRWTTR